MLKVAFEYQKHFLVLEFVQLPKIGDQIFLRPKYLKWLSSFDALLIISANVKIIGRRPYTFKYKFGELPCFTIAKI